MTTPDQHAAQLRVQELQAVRAELLRDSDDPRVLSEICWVESEIARCQQALEA